jgi:hypothetical protein
VYFECKLFRGHTGAVKFYSLATLRDLQYNFLMLEIVQVVAVFFEILTNFNQKSAKAFGKIFTYCLFFCKIDVLKLIYTFSVVAGLH